MSVAATIPPTFHIGRGRLLGLVCMVVVATAAVTSAVVTYGVDAGGGSAQANVPTPAVVSSPIPMTGYLDGITSKPTVVPQAAGTRSHAGPDTRISVMQFSPAELSAGAVWGYSLPDTRGLTRESVLASLDPRSRRYVEKVTALTFAQLAAGAAGSP
jgi:hypothetical protein